MTTLASSIIYPFALDVCGRIFGGLVLTEDMLICTIFTGLGIGISLGIVIRSGASTGGIDIPTLVLHKYLHIPVSVILYAFDFCILLSQAIFRPIENVLYGIVLIMVYTIVLDKMLLVGTTRTEIKIISEKSEEIIARILSDIDRGVTILHGEGGFSRDEKQIVMTVVSNREVPKVEKLIHSIDPECFMIINRINEVNGRGFSMKKDTAKLEELCISLFCIWDCYFSDILSAAGRVPMRKSWILCRNFS